MTQDWKSRLSDWLPPMAIRAWTRWIRGDGYDGEYGDWRSAMAHAVGFDDPRIPMRVAESLMKVQRGEAACERDGVVFREIQYQWPVVAGLLRAAVAHTNRLHVVDFGGSLGSTFFQCKALLKPLTELRWSVIEQARFVEQGRRYFQDDHLRFYEQIDECLGESPADVLLLSSVLSYLEAPYWFIGSLRRYAFDNIIVDRTAMWEHHGDTLTVRRVPAAMYGFRTSYPAWIFNRAGLIDAMTHQADLVCEFTSIDGPFVLGGKHGTHRGFILSCR